MTLRWFKRSGILFIPVSPPGWIIFVAAAACAVYSFIDVDSRSHSVSDTLMNFVFCLLIIGAVYSLVAYLTGGSGRGGENDARSGRGDHEEAQPGGQA